MSQALKTALALALWSYATVSSATEGICSAEAPKLKVLGYAEVEAIADVVRLNFSVDSLDKNSAKAYESVEKRVFAFIEALATINADQSLEIISDNIAITPQSHFEEQKQVFDGYKASRAVSIKTSDFAKISKITELAINSGVNIVEGFSYELKNPKALQDKADDLAIADANAKALRLQQGFKIKSLKPCLLEFRRNNPPRLQMRLLSKAFATNNSDSAPYTPDEQRISSSVYAEFLIE